MPRRAGFGLASRLADPSHAFLEDKDAHEDDDDSPEDREQRGAKISDAGCDQGGGLGSGH